jgi:hypothetical protein
MARSGSYTNHPFDAKMVVKHWKIQRHHVFRGKQSEQAIH